MIERLKKLKEDLDVVPLRDLEFNAGAIYMINYVIKILEAENELHRCLVCNIGYTEDEKFCTMKCADKWIRKNDNKN